MADYIHAAGVTTTTENAYNDLFAGDEPGRVENTVTLLLGQNLVAGALLGRVTASGKYVLSLSASSDGSQLPVAILANDTNATAADVRCVVYEAGMFDENKIVLGTAHTIASVRDGLIDRNIYMRKNVKA